MKHALIAITLVIVFSIPSIYAHHSSTGVDKKTTFIVDGVVKQFIWRNPHAWLTVEVLESNGRATWVFEMASAKRLAKTGWKSTSVKVGDKVTVAAHPMRNREHSGAVFFVTLPSGERLNQ
jgi:hypothetical protein